MKKVININFQGRVIPIEESAYDMLKQYVESLRKFFANEEGRDEIINDIEGRIAELFVEILKKGSTCITEENVEGIIQSMGRPEDFEGEEGRVHSQLEGDSQEQANSSHRSTDPGYEAPPRGRLYRDDSDKILGGVCGGVASYLRIDPTIVRLVFALIAFVFGGGILLYIILWVILPSKPLAHTPSTKRLYRNPEEKVIAGVASGIASYFDIAIWIPRLIFSLPLVAGIVTSIVRSAFFFDVDPFPGILFGSFGGTLFVVYAVLWAVIPEAKSASEKLEMRGEKVDLNTIKNTIQEDLEGFKQRAEKWSGEAKDKAEEFAKDFGSTVKQKGQQFGSEMNYATRSGGSRIGRAIGIMFKAFFLFIAGIIAFALLITLLAFMVAGVGVFPLKDFFLEGIWQNFLAWTTLLLFLGVPVVAFITWVIRRIMGVRSKNRYLGFTFAGLWVMGLIAAGMLAVSIARNFDARARDTQEYVITQPTSGKLIVKVPNSKVKVIGRWFRMDGILSMSDDSLILNNVRLRIVKSKDSLYHMSAAKYANGKDEGVAVQNIKEINYGFNQQDSTIWLDRGFSVQKGTRFRNQAVAVILQVPVGKRILIDRSVARRLNWFHMGMGHNDWEWEDDYNGSDYQYYNDNVEYIMTVGGLERVDDQGKRKDGEDNADMNEAKEKYKQSREELQKEYERKQKEAEDLKKELETPADTTRYRYKKTTTAVKGIDNTDAPAIFSLIKSA
ncbi:PspC domain-containing protein [Sediminibacterium soli]|uniref:PspC domain-containing protein n=1 Tax=Sediminibacterium soli TaxID=2698829 RepID=UPI001379BAA2|nr:PspC domain-containing protein [Sediminibacterium soli]NCI47766.1 PspC domain-containing protein [Sediminibacterium soli]